MFLIGHKIDALNFYDLKISSQLSFSNKLWDKTQESSVVSFFSRLGVQVPELSQTILGICDVALQELLEAKAHAASPILAGKIKEVHDVDRRPVVTTEDGETIKAKKIFAAKLDPALAAYGKIHTNTILYQQRVVSSLCSLTEELDEAYSRSFPYGFISLLPLDGKRAYVRCCHQDELASKLEMPKTEYIKFLNGELQKESESDPLLLSTPLSYPPILLDEVNKRLERTASWTQANSFYRNNLVLFGDAAHEYYPYLMEDQNINLNEVSMLADIMAKRRGLKLYSAWAMSQSNVYGNVQHILRSITQSSGSLVKYLQAAGIGLCNQFPLATYFLNEAAHRLLQSPFSLDLSKQMGLTASEAKLFA